MRLVFWTSTPTHHQSQFFAALRSRGVEVLVRYCHRVAADRLSLGWGNFESLPDGESILKTGTPPLLQVDRPAEAIHIVPGSSDRLLRGVAVELSRKGIDWVHWSERSHAGLRWWATWPLKKWYGSLVTRHALGAFAIGHMAAEDFVRWGIPCEKIAYLFYAVRPATIDVSPDPVCEKFRQGRTAFTYIGRLSRAKGTDVLLDAFAASRAVANSVLQLVGFDTSNGEFERRAERLHVRPVTLFRGVVASCEISSVLRASSVLILPSRSDGWGVVLNEGAALGLPLIGSDASGASFHVIEPGFNGFRIRAGSIESLVSAMDAYSTNAALVKQHGRNSTRLFELFTPETNAERCLGALMAWKSVQGTGEISIQQQNPAICL